MVTDEQVREFFKSTKLYQPIEIRGIRAEGCTFDATDVLARMNWPDDMTGKSFLDIGCNAGFYVFAARERGASPCVGIDRETNQVKKGEQITVLKELNDVKFTRMDATEIEQLGMQFSVTIMLSVFHHLREPWKVLRLIHKLTVERFYGEFYVLSKYDPKRPKIRPVDRVPEIVEETHIEYPTQWGMAAMLREVGWSEVKFLGAGKNANRVLFLCEK